MNVSRRLRTKVFSTEAILRDNLPLPCGHTKFKVLSEERDMQADRKSPKWAILRTIVYAQCLECSMAHHFVWMDDPSRYRDV